MDPISNQSLDFEIHRFTGTHFEMGFQQGQKFIANLNHGLKVIQGLEGFQALRPKWLPNPLFFAAARKKSTKWLSALLAKHAPNQAERLQGIAKGAEIDPSWIYLLVSTEIVLGVLSWELPSLAGVPILVPKRKSAKATSRLSDAILIIIPLSFPS